MDASEIRAKARESLKGNYWYAVLTALIAGFFGALLVGELGVNFTISEEPARLLLGEKAMLILLIIGTLGVIFSFLGLARLILGGVIQLGYSQYLLKQQDREINSVKDLFSQFDRFGRGFLQLFLRNLFTFLWSLLFVFPGIVKSYAYAMTPFIMAENPNLSAIEAINLSKKQMNGYKWELFCLDFSFIGWSFLCLLTFGIGTFFLNPYMNAAHAAFYRDKISPKVTVEVLTEEIPM